MQHFLLGCLIGAALCAAVAVPLLLPWPARVRYLVNANTIDPLLGFGPAPRVSMRVVVVDAVDACGGRLELALSDGMTERRFGRIVNITSGSVVAPLAGLDLSSGARAGLTAFLAGVARTVADKNVTINNLLPGAFDTDRLRGTLKKWAETRKQTVEEAATARKAIIPARRFGEPDEFGAACAFLCSAQAGYITGQNLLIDGGAFPGAF